MRWAARFYPIIDADLCEARGVDPGGAAAACFRGGARVVQLRAKTGRSRSFLALADDVVGAARPYGAVVIVNDRADIARMSGAGGVHVGQDDLPPDAARAVLGAGVVGVSTHDRRQVETALRTSADYLAVGPVHATATKVTGYEARGMDLVRYAAAGGRPVVAIGGITLARAVEALSAGAAAVAVIADLLATGDVEARARDYVRTLGSG